MDWQTAINLGAGAILAFVGFMAKRAVAQQDRTRDDIHDVRNSVQAFQLDVARNYVTHQDLGDIKATLVRIENKLDGKADK